MSRTAPDVRVPRLVGLMAVDARETARARGLLLGAPDRPDFHLAVVDYVVRRYPQAGAEVARESMACVWFDLGPGEGGGGVHEPRLPRPPRGGLQREPDEPGDDPYRVLSPRQSDQPCLNPRCRATIPPLRLRQATRDQPAPPSRSARAGWSGQARMDSAR